MLQTALEFLRKHNEITFATTDGTSPRLRIFQIMRQEGITLYFATSSKKAVWHELHANPNVEYFCLPIAELDYFDLTPTPPVNQHFDLMIGEMNNGYVGERYSK